MSDKSFTPVDEAAGVAPVLEATAASDAVDTGVPGDVEPAPPKTFTQEEVDRIIGAEKAKAERRARREFEAQIQSQRQAPTVLPQREQFANDTDYFEAVIDFKAEEKLNAREQQKRQAEVSMTYADREDTAREKYEDFEITKKQPHEGGPAVSDYMAEVIMASDIGPELLYHLAKNQRESVRIFGLPPLQQAKELGRIEAALSANTPPPPPVKKPSSAPEPITPISSRSHSSANYDPTDPRSDKMSVDSWMKARNQQIAKRHQG